MRACGLAYLSENIGYGFTTDTDKVSRLYKVTNQTKFCCLICIVCSSLYFKQHQISIHLQGFRRYRYRLSLSTIRLIVPLSLFEHT